MVGRHWKTEELDLLRKLWDSTLTVDEVAEKIGRSKNSVKVKVTRLGLRHTKEQTRQILSKKTSGERNGMFGKVSPRRGVKLSEGLRAKMSVAALEAYAKGTRKPMVGPANPAYGKPSTMRGKNLPESAKKTLSEKAKKRWENRAPEWKADKLRQLREGRARLDKDNPSKLELQTEEWLKSLGVEYAPQVVIEFYTVDFLVSSTKVIECQGDYWHANPIKYADHDALNPTQKANVHRDKRKRTYLKNRGYEILELWGNDIRNNPEECLQKIKEFLK
jgi:very-short-patch-repair endonuclease